MGLDMYLDSFKRNINGKVLTLDDVLEYEKVCQGKEECIQENNLEDLYVVRGSELFHWKTPFKELMYWRKANAIHNWFVKHVQHGVDDCNYYEVTKEQLIELHDTCEKVVKKVKTSDGYVINGWSSKPNEYCIENNIELNKPFILNGITYHAGGMYPEIEKGKYIEDISVPHSLLPTTSGFFFGSTDYDEWYVQDIIRTKKELKQIIGTFDFENNGITYNSSW
jgi:hypothetical protein